MRKLSLTAGIMFCLADSALGQNGTSTQSSYWGLIAAFGSVVVGLILANAYVVSLFHSKRSGDTGVLARWNEKWEFSAQALGGFSWWQLALWSLLSLFFELLMIRWISSEIRIFAYFKNFVLVACFLGFGLGCYLSRRRANLLAMIVPLLALTLIVTLPWPGLRVLMRSIPAFVGASSERNLWGAPAEFSFPLLEAALAFMAMVGLLSLGIEQHGTVYWSPYQKLTLSPRNDAGKIIGYDLSTNDSWFQQIVDLSPEFVMSHPKLFEKIPIEWNAYNLPYHFYPKPPSVLVLGSGMGNDVAAALRNGAAQVTAVEIDPLILKLGEKYHLEKPYGSPRVRAVRDDARSYVQNSREHFDLIVFSLLDSHTNSSHFTNIRVDNYVYTLEAIQAAKQLLRPDGIFIVKFQVMTPWIAGRLDGVLRSVFGRAPVQLEIQPNSLTNWGRLFITGSESRVAQALAEPRLAAFVSQHGGFNMVPATLTTDDWPYFYQHEPGLPLSVVVLSVTLVLLCWVLLRDIGAAAGSSLRWHFFFLGAGFMLLEAQIVSKMALLFGTTWLVNSVVIGGLLLLIVAANVLVEFVPRFPR